MMMVDGDGGWRWRMMTDLKSRVKFKEVESLVFLVQVPALT